MKKYVFDITLRVHVSIDEAKLIPLMPDFNKCVGDFGDDEKAVPRHAEHIANLAARGEDFWPSDFVEGYGVVKDAGIVLEAVRVAQTELVQGPAEKAGA